MTELTLAVFEPLVGTAFVVDPGTGGAPVSLTLTAVRALPAPAGDAARPPFALDLHGPPEPAFAQQTLRLEHAALSAVQIFVVPVARDASATTYEAIFS